MSSTDRRTDKVNPVYPPSPQTSLGWGIMSMSGHKDTSPPCSPPTPNDTPDADPEPSTANDMNPSTDSETAPAQNKRFPRFLVIEGLDPKKLWEEPTAPSWTKRLMEPLRLQLRGNGWANLCWWKTTMRHTPPICWSLPRLVVCLSGSRPTGVWTTPRAWSGFDKLPRTLQMKTWPEIQTYQGATVTSPRRKMPAGLP